jgi:hypothetical protein
VELRLGVGALSRAAAVEHSFDGGLISMRQRRSGVLVVELDLDEP